MTDQERLTLTMSDFIKAYKENPYSETTKLLAKAVGYEVVIRQGKPYIRKIPNRFVGGAVESAYWFGKINHENRNGKGNVIKPSGIIQNAVAVKSAQEFKGSKFVVKLPAIEKLKKQITLDENAQA